MLRDIGDAVCSDIYVVVRCPSASVSELTEALDASEAEIVGEFQSLRSAEELCCGAAADTALHSDISYQISLLQTKHEEDLGRLLSSIAHHWRQPLNILGLLVQDMHESYCQNKLNDGYMQEFSELSLDLIQNLSLTIDSFRSSFCNLGFEMQKNVPQHIYDIMKLSAPEYEAENIALRFQCSCERRSIICDSFETYPPCDNLFVYNKIDIAKFNLAFMSLLDNAKSAVNLSMNNNEISSGLIEVAIQAESSRLTIKMKNNGALIDESIREDIFQPYFTTKEVGSGRGLGLYIAKTVLTNFFNGSIDFSNHSDGVEFTVSMADLPHN